MAVTYLNLDSDDRELGVLAQEHSDATRLVTIVQDRLNAGEDDRMSLLEAQRKATQIELNEMNVQDEIAALSDHLSRMMGLPDDSLSAVSSSIPALPSVQMAADSSNESDSPGVQATLANARSKQELSFGVNRYRLRPQMYFGVNYSRIDTGQDDYTTYYPGFYNKSQNAVSVGSSTPTSAGSSIAGTRTRRTNRRLRLAGLILSRSRSGTSFWKGARSCGGARRSWRSAAVWRGSTRRLRRSS